MADRIDLAAIERRPKFNSGLLGAVHITVAERDALAAAVRALTHITDMAEGGPNGAHGVRRQIAERARAALAPFAAGTAREDQQ